MISAFQQRLFLGVGVAYAGLVLAILPWAREPALADPRIATVSAAAVFTANLFAALLLGAWYRWSGRAPVLLLACAQFYGAAMTVLHLTTFPGALFVQPLFGSAQTVGWLYLASRAGTMLACVAAVLLQMRGLAPEPAQVRAARLGGALLATAAAVALASAFAAWAPALVLAGGQWSAANVAIQVSIAAVAILGLALIVARRAFGDPLYLWLGLALVAALVDTIVGMAAGGRYTLGWHVSRASFVVSSFLLLIFLVNHVSARQPTRALGMVAAYGGALVAVCAALLLRWFLDPWLGAGTPFITLFGAIAIAVWLGGWLPAALAAALGYVAVGTIFMEPFGAFWLGSTAYVLQFGLYALSCVFIISLGEAMRRARDRARVSEEALQQRADELERSDTNKSQFLALLAHELRNPLAPLRTGLAILKMAPDAATAAQTREIMERQIAQLTRLIDDLLDVSRIDRGKLELRAERVSLDAVVRAAIETAMPGIEARSHELVVRYAGQPLYVEGDPVRLAQVVANLLNNAAKFTPPRGRIELATRAEEGSAVVRVTDSGIGIAREHLDKVFEMFVQVEEGRRTAAGGLGLGLSLVRSIVGQHGGRVEARSDGAGKGAEFIVRLPLVAPPASISGPQQVLAAAGPGRRVLIVDDNAEAASSAAELLRLEGHVVQTANDGPAALRIAQALVPDIAFVDLGMPGMDGCEVARRLRAMPSLRGTRLVALTGLGQAADIERSRAAGFELHLTKPADPQRLVRLAAGQDAALASVVPIRGAGSGN